MATFPNELSRSAAHRDDQWSSALYIIASAYGLNNVLRDRLACECEGPKAIEARALAMAVLSAHFPSSLPAVRNFFGETESWRLQFTLDAIENRCTRESMFGDIRRNLSAVCATVMGIAAEYVEP